MQKLLKEKQIIIFVLILVIVIIYALIKHDAPADMCRCIEVKGDEANYVCYTPDGAEDIKGECVGPKIYNN